MRGEHGIQVIVGQLPLQRLKTYPLQNHIPVGIGKHFFVDAVAPAVARVREFKNRNARLKWTVFE